MKTIIARYEQHLKASGKKLKVVLAEKLRGLQVHSYLFLSETDKEWIIHPAILMEDGNVSTGNGTYLFKDRYSYKEAKEIFEGRL